MFSARLFFLLLLFMLLRMEPLSAQPKPEQFVGWEGLEHPVPAWFSEAKFGIYFHWGVYTVPAYNSEWYSRSLYVPGTGPRRHHTETYGPPARFGYKEFIPQFKAEKFNADDWVALFKKAGARFTGPVAEHADGFSMWNSRVNPWNAARMGPKKDIVGEMTRAVRKAGLKLLTTFHHQWQWGWYPTFNDSMDAARPEFAALYGPRVSREAWQQKDSAERPDAAFCATWLEKVKEVITAYQPDLLYFDSRLSHIGQEYRKEVLRSFYTPDATGANRGILYKSMELPAGTGIRTFEKTRSVRIIERPWLSEEPISTYSWSYTSDMELRSAPAILRSLVDIVSKNGVYLLNVCPKADGSIPKEQEDILLSIGAWMQTNGEAIYGTTPWVTFGEGPMKEADERNEGRVGRRGYTARLYARDDIRYTKNGSTVYAFLMGDTLQSEPLLLRSFALPGAGGGVNSMRLLGRAEKLQWSATPEGLKVWGWKEQTGQGPLVVRIETRPAVTP